VGPGSHDQPDFGVADASSNLFKAMQSAQRPVDHSRSLNDDAVLKPEIQNYLHATRDAELPRSAAATCSRRSSFPSKNAASRANG